MKFTQFKKQDEVRNTIILEMMKNKIRKKHLAKEIGLSYPTMLAKLDNPFLFKVSELLLLCEIVEIDINELLIKY
jgi:DNA-binding Xre family transcriptional regulator